MHSAPQESVRGPRLYGSKGHMWENGILRYKLSLQKPNLVYRPNQKAIPGNLTPKSKNLKSSEMPSSTFRSYQTKSSMEGSCSRNKSARSSMLAMRRSFDTRFGRMQKECDAFRKKDTAISERLLLRKLKKLQMDRHELDPVLVFYDEYTTESIIAANKKERERQNLPDNFNFKRFKLPPESSIKVGDPNRVFYWG